MKKFLSRVILIILLFFISIYIIHSESDFFVDFEEKFPEFSQKNPAITDLVNELSALPTIPQIIEEYTREDIPEEYADNSYIENSPKLTFYENESLGIVVNDDNTFTIFGDLSEISRPNIAVQVFNSKDEKLSETLFATDLTFEFSKTIDIPETDDTLLNIEVFTGKKKYGDYSGFANDYIYLEKINGSWQLYKSPVYISNKEIYDSPRSLTKALASTSSVQPENSAIISVAKQLTSNTDDDYEKALILHDWICSYLHYDNDSLSNSKISAYTSTEVLKNRKAVCLGFANLYAALLRSLDIPCTVVTGYALDISSGSNSWNSSNIKTSEANHAWNEVYINGRWIIVDSTWDTFNNYEDGEMQKGSQISHLYFDCNIDFFSNNHRIMYYDKY